MLLCPDLSPVLLGRKLYIWISRSKERSETEIWFGGVPESEIVSGKRRVAFESQGSVS